MTLTVVCGFKTRVQGKLEGRRFFLLRHLGAVGGCLAALLGCSGWVQRRLRCCPWALSHASLGGEVEHFHGCLHCLLGRTAQQGNGLGNYLCFPGTGVALLLISSWAGPSQCFAKQQCDGDRASHRKGNV